MFCDIYNLGRGPVFAHGKQSVFGINNLQVIEGFVYSRIPQEVLEVACGTLGKWKPGGEPPLLEITHHHEASSVWKVLPARLRHPHIKVGGTADELVPVPKDDPERSFYPPGSRPMKLRVRMDPPSAPPLDLKEILPDFMRSLGQGVLGPRPQLMPPEPKKPKGAAAPKAATAPPIEDQVMVGGQMVPLVGRPETAKDPNDVPPNTCEALKGDGTRCRRPATMNGVCGYHSKAR